MRRAPIVNRRKRLCGRMPRTDRKSPTRSILWRCTR
jgi:hypothetical protein